MKKINTLFIAIGLLLVTLTTTAQDYKTGIGFRLGGLNSGLTVKHFISSDAALEGILGFGYRSFLVTGLYEKHVAIENAQGLKWLYGGGAHIGFFRYGGDYYIFKSHGNKYYYEEHDGDGFVIGGIDFIIGMDYKFNKAPINIALDLKPFVDVNHGLQGYFDGAISFRFVF